MSIKLTISYDGSSFFGWQKTSAGPTIEETLERALRQILYGSDSSVPICLEAASRTDRGVHAKGQTVHFSGRLGIDIDLSRLRRSLNAVLPPTISVQSIEHVPPSFHSTLSATSKEYRYFLCTGPVQIPMNRLYSWHVPRPLHLDNMRKASEFFLGTKDFTACANGEIENGVCTLHDVSILPWDEGRLQIVLRGNRFLYKMVRNLVGTLVAIGHGKLTPEWIPVLLSSRDRTNAGPTAPARGLFLWKVFYERESS